MSSDGSPSLWDGSPESSQLCHRQFFRNKVLRRDRPQVSFLSLVFRLVPLSLHFLMAWGYLAAFVALKDGSLHPRRTFIFSTMAPVVECLVEAVASGPSYSSLLRLVHWECCYGVLWLSSPVVRSLASSVADDSVYILSGTLLFSHAVLCYCGGAMVPWAIFVAAEAEVRTGTTNSLTPLFLFAALLLSSRIEDAAAGAFLALGHALFLNGLRAVRLVAAASRRLFWTICVTFFIGVYFLLDDATTYLRLQRYVLLVFPLLYYRMLRYRVVVGGPWDVWMQVVDRQVCPQ